MALSTIEKRTHQRVFSEWLDQLRSPIVHGVIPNMEIALAGYAGAAAAFGPGGQFDTVTPSDYRTLNQEFLIDFQEISTALSTTFEPPKQAMTITEIAQWMANCLIALDSGNPGIFDYIGQAKGG